MSLDDYRRRTSVQDAVLAGAGQRDRFRPGPGPQQPLLGRETEILTLAGRGKTNAEIGRELFISEATVKTHLLRAYAKLGVSSRTAAVTAAMERGLLNSK